MGLAVIPHVRALVTFSGALAGLMMVIIGNFIQSGLLIPDVNIYPKILRLPSTWQVPAVLLCAIICGPKSGVIASVAYITVGLLYLPIFHSGGRISYVTTPGFGYLIGFVPTAWISGRHAYR